MTTRESQDPGAATGAYAAPAVCPTHREPWVEGDFQFGRRRCSFYVPELGASEDYPIHPPDYEPGGPLWPSDDIPPAARGRAPEVPDGV